MIQHTCRCGNTYEDNDPDAYFCPPCVAERKIRARDIDAKVGSTIGQQPNGGFTQYANSPKGKGGFAFAKDLGL